MNWTVVEYDSDIESVTREYLIPMSLDKYKVKYKLNIKDELN